ncbi:hypothetical protein [uncultured Duncaniella sp.]|uniref:hypothetical protein n=1 Tax=uncultured Duncaniella sp. TaxID=2768039 RepID=UPI00262F158F|nr:hypothetical protein [uncultured Duncaniella sp.]
MVYIRFFADDDSQEKWETDPNANAKLLLGQFSFKVSDAGGDEYTLATRITKLPTSPAVKGSANTLAFSYNSYYGGDPTNLDTEDGTATVSVNGTEIGALEQTLRPGNSYTMDLGPYLTAERNTVTLTVMNAHGKRRTFSVAVQIVEISIAFGANFDESAARGSDWELPVQCNGVEAQVNVLIDGTEAYSSSAHNSSVTFRIDSDNKLNAGAHKLEVYAENSQYGLRSETLTASFIKRGLSTPTICIGKDADREATLYANAAIPYYIYWPNAKAGDTATVTARVLGADGAVLKSGISQTATLGINGESGMQMLRLALTEQAYLQAGTISVVLACGSASVTHKIKVTNPGVNLSAASECKIHLAAAGRSNTDSDAEDWKSEYNGQVTARVVRSAGFRLDGDNGFDGDAFHIPTGRRITLAGSQPFGKDFGANSATMGDRTGKTLEFEFATRNCTNSHAKVIECLNGSTGFVVYADGMELRTTAGSVKTIWSDETRLRIGIVVEGTTRHCVNKLIDKTEELDANIAYLYVNGVVVRIMDYLRASMKQAAPQDIVIGSDECDVDLYSVRIYDKALTVTQMIGNYAFDTPDASDKVAIARRNDILNSYGDVDFAKVREALPSTPYKIWEIAKMPTGKKDWQKATTEFVNPNWEPSEDNLVNASFVCTDHNIALDGTSSLSYPDPYKNWANDYGKGKWTVEVGGAKITITEYSITDGVAEGETEDVDKVNFASSEGVFNILAANAHYHILTGVARSYPSILTPMQATQQAIGDVHYRQSLAGYPIIGWLREYNNGIPSVRFLSIYNRVNNKYSGSPYGITRENKGEMWEVEDNVNFFMDKCADGKWTDGKWDDLLTTLYYARFPKTDANGNDTGKAPNAEGAAEANLQSRHLRAFHNWIQSCNPSVADRYKARHGEYEPLSAPVTYGSIRYTADSPEYRLAKFRAESADWMNKENAMFYFLFFDALIGKDSFDKNMTITLTKG